MANDRKKLIKYLFNPKCSDVKSKIDALRFAKKYFNSDSIISSNIYAIYDELGLIPEQENRYDLFVNKLISIFDIKGNVLEIGGGNLPCVGERIAKRQIELGKGTITVYDPSLSVKKSKYPNLILCKDELTMTTDIQGYDLLIGAFPCDATELMIHRALTENKDFFIQLCDCVIPFKDMSEEEYIYCQHHPNVYQQMLVDAYINYAKHFNRKVKVRYDLSTPTLSCRHK